MKFVPSNAPPPLLLISIRKGFVSTSHRALLEREHAICCMANGIETFLKPYGDDDEPTKEKQAIASWKTV